MKENDKDASLRRDVALRFGCKLKFKKLFLFSCFAVIFLELAS